MTDIRTKNVDGLLIATMSRGKANALNVGMVGELNAVLAQARDPRFAASSWQATVPNFSQRASTRKKFSRTTVQP